MSISKTATKIVAAGTAGIFLAQGVLCAEIPTLRKAFTDDHLRRVEELTANPGTLLVSSAAATVAESYRGTSGKVLVHIQDAHTNLGAQKNLATVLDEIITQYGVDLVFVEGGTGNDSLSFLREYAEPETRRRTAARFLERGEISGEEYLDIISGPEKPFLLWGIEDPGLYEKSLVSYSRLVDIRKAATAYLDRVGAVVRTVRPRIYPRELVEFEKTAADFRKTKIPFTDYYEYLADTVAKSGADISAHQDFARLREVRELEKTVDFKSAGAEQAQVVKELARREPILAELAQGTEKLKFGRTPMQAFYDTLERRMQEQGMDGARTPALEAYIRYVRAFGAIDTKALLGDFEAIEEAQYDRYADKPDVRRLREISRYADILRNYYSLKLKPSEFSIYKRDVKNFKSSEWVGYLNRKLMEFGRHGEVLEFDPVLDERQEEVAAFYRTIESRDYAFVDRAFKKMEETGRNVAVIICGGYHTPHLKELLKEKQSSFVVVTPHVSEETDIENYERVLLGSLDPTKRWVVTAREGTVRPRRAAELKTVVPALQSRLIESRLFGKTAAVINRELGGLRTATAVNHNGRFDFKPVVLENGVVVIFFADGNRLVLNPEARVPADFARSIPASRAAALGTRAPLPVRIRHAGKEFNVRAEDRSDGVWIFLDALDEAQLPLDERNIWFAYTEKEPQSPRANFGGIYVPESFRGQNYSDVLLYLLFEHFRTPEALQLGKPEFETLLEHGKMMYRSRGAGNPPYTVVESQPTEDKKLKSKSGARVPAEIQRSIETILGGAAGEPGLISVAQDRGIGRTAQDALISAVQALSTALLDDRDAADAFIDVAAAGVFIGRAQGLAERAGNAEAAGRIRAIEVRVGSETIELSIALGDMDMPIDGLAAPPRQGLAVSLAGRLYALLLRLRQLAGDEGSGYLPAQVLRNVLEYPHLRVSDTNRDNETWQDDFESEIASYVETALAFIAERELVDSETFGVLNHAARADLENIRESFSIPELSVFSYVLGHVEGALAKIETLFLDPDIVLDDAERDAFENIYNQVDSFDVEGIRTRVPVLLGLSPGDPDAVRDELGTVSALLNTVAVTARHDMLKHASEMNYGEARRRAEMESEIINLSKAAATARQIIDSIRDADAPGSRTAAVTEQEIDGIFAPLAVDAVAGSGIPASGESRDIRIALENGQSIRAVVTGDENGSARVEIFLAQQGFQDRLLRAVNLSSAELAQRREALKRGAALAEIQEGPPSGSPVATALETAASGWQRSGNIRGWRTDYLASARAVTRELESLKADRSTPVAVTVPLEAFKDFAAFDDGKNFDALLKLFLLEAAHLLTEPSGRNVSFFPDTRDAVLLARADQVIAALKDELRSRAQSDAALEDQWLELLGGLDAVTTGILSGRAPEGAVVVNLFNARQAGRPVTGDINIPVKLDSDSVRLRKTGMEVPPVRAILTLGIAGARSGLSREAPQDIPRPILNAWQTLLGEPIAPKDAAEFGGVLLGLVTDIARVLRFALPPVLRVDLDSIIQFVDAITRFA